MTTFADLRDGAGLLRVAQAECNEPELRDFLFKGTAVQDDEDDEDNEEQNANDPPPNTHAMMMWFAGTIMSDGLSQRQWQGMISCATNSRASFARKTQDI